MRLSENAASCLENQSYSSWQILRLVKEDSKDQGFLSLHLPLSFVFFFFPQIVPIMFLKTKKVVFCGYDGY